MIGAALACVALPVEAARRDFHFEPLPLERGLAQNTVNALLEDRHGFIWLATQGGLHRYDGQQLRLFRHQPDDPESLPDSFVTALAADADDGLWVGTNTRYVARLDLATGRVQRFAPQPAILDERRQFVQDLAWSAQGLWISSRAGIELLSADGSDRHEVLELAPGHSAGQLAVDDSGRTWAATSAGLYLLQPGRPALLQPGSPAATAILVDRDGQLWLGGTDLHRFDPETGSTTLVPLGSGRPAGSVIRAIERDHDGRIWVAVADAGVFRRDPAGSTWVHVHEAPAIPAALPENDIRSLMVDRSGLLWLGGTIRGVSLTDPAGTRFTHLLDLDSPAGPVHANSARVLLEAGDGEIWVGTDSDGLKRVDPESGHFEQFTASLEAALPAEADSSEGPFRVMGLADGAGGRIWVGTSRGLLELDPQTRRARHLPLQASGIGALPLAIRGIDHARGGGMWLSTLEGLLLADPETGQVRQFRRDPTDPHSLSHDLVHCVLEGDDGRVWVCTNAGLSLLDPATGHVERFIHDARDPSSLSGDRVRAMLAARDGSLWVGSHGGLDRVVRDRDGRIGFERFQGRERPDGRGFTVFNLLEDENGLLWLGTNEGIVRFDPRRGTFRGYGLRDGLQDHEFNGGAQLRLADGRLALGGIRGVNLFNPRRMDDSDFSPGVVLLGARVGSAPENRVGLTPVEHLQIPSSARMLRLHFGVLDYAAPRRSRYRYRLEGFDPDWIEVATPEATFTNLGAGDYTFRVQASNRDGRWSSQELVLPVSVTAPWWDTRTAHAGYVLLAALFAWGVLALARQRRREEQRLLGEIREREERLKLALWGSGDEFWDLRIADNTLYRMGGKEVFGAGRASPLSTNAWRSQAIHPEDMPRVQAVLERHMRGESEAFESEHRIRNAEGGWVWVRSRGKVVERDGNGQPLRIAGTAHDISAIRRAERDRRIAIEVLNSMAEAVVVVDLEFRFFSVNPAFSRITGYAADEVLGRDGSLLDSPQHGAEFYRKVRRILLETGHWAGEMWQRRKDGEEFLGWLECAEVRDEAGERSHFVKVLTDVTDKKRAEQELRYLANYDTLTGLPNRALLSERLARAIVRARRQDTRVAVLFLDLDRFKDINDSLGHAAGDRILKATAARLLATVSSSDTVARLSGDEFTVVLEDVDGAPMVERVAREILAAFTEPLDIDDRHDVSISPSIGISLYPDHALVPTDLLKFADTAMYQAKAIGRNTYQIYTEAMDAETRRRAVIAAALRRALDRGEFRLVFQPRLSLADGMITGVEALLRWHSGELGEVSPDVFIPLAEETGLILKIGEWVVNEACMTLRRWRHHGLLDIAMAVNVSVLQLLRGDMPELVEAVLAATGVPGDRIEIEVTESMVMANAEQTTAALNRLRDMGVSIAIDDFGTGYSSLVYLKRLPIDTLKIDKEFVGDLTRDPDDEAITATVITMAHSLGLNVVAEGVETQQQMDYLRAQGCDEIQGYWLSPPLDAHHCLAFMRTWQPAAIPETEA